jgi:predicted Fe-Mo cluster-binding NifX family protein
MKIAVVTDDGVTISQHFGRAPFYAVLTAEDGRIVAVEQREKFAHHHGPGEHGHEGGHARPEAENTHGRMLSPIGDCEVMIARGMGNGAYYSLQEAGIKPIITDVADIQEAVERYLKGDLTNHVERLH